VPAAQLTQAPDDTYFPEAHVTVVVVHVDAPAVEVVPLAHAVHDDFPVVLVYVPAEHAVWAEAPLDPT